MLKRLDRYIIAKFLGTYFFSLVLILSIAVVFDISEKSDDFFDSQAPLSAIVFDYYVNFIPYYMNMFSPLFVFISVIFFTSKLAGNSEIIAMLAGGVSFKRLMVPYFISATIILCCHSCSEDLSFHTPHARCLTLRTTTSRSSKQVMQTTYRWKWSLA